MAWFRKNNSRIMAVAVIVLMLVFISGPAMSYLASHRTGRNKVVAYYGEGRKITSKDFDHANRQLELLKQLGANIFLRPQDPRLAPAQDLRIVLLGELLFAEGGSAVESIGLLRQIIAREGYPISDRQINGIYTREYPPYIYWLLLIREAKTAGVSIQAEVAKSQLERLIPRLNPNVTYPLIVAALMRRQSVSEGQLLQTYADMLAIIEYAKLMTMMQDSTSEQILHEAIRRGETFDVEYVKFRAGVFAEELGRPGEDRIMEQFEKYKGFFAGEVSDENPYGFGYKLPNRIQLEYIAVRLDDVATTVQQPTQQEKEDYYKQNLSLFTKRVPSDPNDTNSPLMAHTLSFPEVAALISRQMYQEKIDARAEQILLDARSITEASLLQGGNEMAELTDQQLRDLAGDYEKAAEQLSDQYGLSVYAGNTGLLSAFYMLTDDRLNSLYLKGVSVASVSLPRVAFAVGPLKDSELGPLDVRPPRLYQNIGPLQDSREPMEGYRGKNVMLVRVVRAEKSAEPGDISEIVNWPSVQFDEQLARQPDANSIKQLVIEDIKKLEAMGKTREKAEEFAQLAAKEGWQTAVDKFKELYGDSSQNTFELQSAGRMRRVSEETLAMQRIRLQGNPASRTLLRKVKIDAMLKEKLYGLVPDDSTTLPEPGMLLEFKPDMSCYCVKSMTVDRLYQEEFDKLKAASAIRPDFIDSQAFATVHYSPENIVKRMNFSTIKQQQDTDDTDANSADTE